MRVNGGKNNITTGHVTFYSQLKINETSTEISNLDIEITNIRSSNFGTNAYDVKTPTYNPSSATFNVGLVPNDYMEYEVEISNLGTIDGQISIADLNYGNNNAFICHVEQTSDRFYDDN